MASNGVHPSPVKTELAADLEKKKILGQVEYYFGDINLPRDKFLQEEMKQDGGWVPLATMLKCNRLAALSTDEAVIAEALKDSRLIDVSEDGKKIRRSPEVPLPENTLEYWQEIKRRTVYMKGFPQDATLDEIAEFVRQFGEVKNVLMRKTKATTITPKVFKGSVFVTYADEEQAKRVAALKDLKFKEEHELVNQMQEEYWANKHAERLAQRELKKQMRRNTIEEQNKAHYVKGLVLKVAGLPTGEKEVNIDELKQFFEPYAKAAYVVLNGTEGTVRFFGSEEGIAAKVWQKAVDAATDGKVMLKESELTGTVLEGEEETAYWTEFNKARVAKQQRMKGKGAGKEQVRDGRGKRKRAADKGFGNEGKGSKKAKRTVFKDEDDDEEVEESAAKTEQIEAE